MLTGSLTELLLAALAFTGGHFLLSSTPLRGILAERLGEKGFQGLFSLFAALTLLWLIVSYAHAPHLALWTQPAWASHLPILVMPCATILLVGSLRRDNPTSLGSDPTQLQPERLGLFAITRHPMLWAFALWAGVHIPPNGDAASLIFFGSFLLLGLAGTWAIDAKIRATNPVGWMRLVAFTSNVPFAALLAGRSPWSWQALGWWPLAGGLALFLVLLLLHPWLFGASPLPWQG